MKKFMIGYYGGDKPGSEEEGQAHMQKWKNWIENLGDNVVNAGTPLLNTHVLTKSAISPETDSSTLKGFAIIKAENFDNAMEMAKTDPFLLTNGTIRISEMMEMG